MTLTLQSRAGDAPRTWPTQGGGGGPKLHQREARDGVRSLDLSIQGQHQEEGFLQGLPGLPKELTHRMERPVWVGRKKVHDALR